MEGVVYILRSLSTEKFYVGSTNDLKRRLEEHKEGKSKYTRETGPYELMFSQKYNVISDARKAERWLKAQKSSKFLSKIIEEGIIEKKFDF